MMETGPGPGKGGRAEPETPCPGLEMYCGNSIEG